jgi:hypothetical protein
LLPWLGTIIISLHKHEIYYISLKFKKTSDLILNCNLIAILFIYFKQSFRIDALVAKEKVLMPKVVL